MRILDVYSSVSIYAGSQDRKYEIIYKLAYLILYLIAHTAGLKLLIAYFEMFSILTELK